jgi:hypothetical protein
LSLKSYLDFGEYKKGLFFRIIVFCFMGLGWDVLMTLLQQIVSGKLTIHAQCPASAWMYLAYGGIPLLFYPVTQMCRFLRFPYVLRILVLLLVFYVVEYNFGSTLRMFGIMPWDYNWYLDPIWTLDGIITWHPAFLVAWTVFVVLAGWLDSVLRVSYPTIQENLSEYWKGI